MRSEGFWSGKHSTSAMPFIKKKLLYFPPWKFIIRVLSQGNFKQDPCTVHLASTKSFNKDKAHVSHKYLNLAS